MSIYAKGRFTRMFSLLLACGLTGACSNSKDSTAIEISEIYVDIELSEKSGSNSARITANLYDGSITGGGLELVDGEYLTARYGDQEVRLKKDEELLEVDYDGRLETLPEGGLFTIILHRANGDSHSMEIEMPPSFNVTAPDPGEVYHEDSELELRWEEAQPSGTINIAGHLACESVEDGLELDIDNENETWTAPDIGASLVPIDELAANMRRETAIEDEELLAGRPCDLNLEVYRENQKILDDTFAAGSTITATKTVSIDDLTLFIGAD